MGSDSGQDDEAPPHRVFVDAFELAVFPVTRAEYEAFVRATGHELPRDWADPIFAQPDLPVVGVSWHDASAYCAWRSREEARSVRLPTEAEWEFAARGNQDGRFPWGDAPPPWIPNGARGPLDAPWRVTLGEPNGFGLYGIAANVHEWCADWHDKEYYRVSPDRNPQGPDRGVRRASRGGAWRHAVTISRVTQRSKLDPSFRYTDYGFRIARAIRAAGRRIDREDDAHAGPCRGDRQQRLAIRRPGGPFQLEANRIRQGCQFAQARAVSLRDDDRGRPFARYAAGERETLTIRANAIALSTSATTTVGAPPSAGTR